MNILICIYLISMIVSIISFIRSLFFDSDTKTITLGELIVTTILVLCPIINTLLLAGIFIEFMEEFQIGKRFGRIMDIEIPIRKINK